MNQRAAPAGEFARVLLSAECRSLRRQLRPLVWVTLEEVALDALQEDGRLVARTSARQIAERLKVNPGTAAGALRVLRDRGLVRLARDHGQAGQFGLSMYVVGEVSGLTVVPPNGARLHLVSPAAENPTDWCPELSGEGAVRPYTIRPNVVEPRVGKPYMDNSPLSSSLRCSGTEAFEFGRGSS